MPGICFSELRVLIVDDHEFALKHALLILNSLGINKVNVADSGEEALHFLDHTDQLPHVIITDINMPEMDGVALLRHLALRRIKSGIIFVSGVDERIVQAAETLGTSQELYVLGSIAKPIKSAPLIEALNTLELNKSVIQAPLLEPITESELLEGLANNALHLVYHPKVSIQEQKLTGVEALARWTHPERGILGPSAFIPLAEEIGQIDILTQSVLNQAMAQGGKWQAAGFDFGISVNYSVDSLHRFILPEFISSIAKVHAMRLDRLTIEVTESLVMHEVTSTIEVLTRLRLLGIELALDDFGTGYATIEQLQRIPFTELKMDRVYVNGAANDKKVRAILESSVLLGKGLGLKLVAEGVENQNDWDLVAALGCDEVQGFFIAKPMCGEEILAWKDEWESKKVT